MDRPQPLTRLRCNELLRDCYGKGSAGDLVMLPAQAVIDEKIGDCVNYLILLEALLTEAA